MKPDIPRRQDCRIAVLCTQSQFSYYCLEGLLKRQIRPSQAVLPGVKTLYGSSKHPSIVTADTARHEESIDSLATKHGFALNHDQLLDEQAFLRKLQQQHVNLLLVACFPYKIHRDIYNNICSVNIHPSLLPAYKGPSPVFWQLYKNEQRFGVSLHYLSEQWDSGSVISQVELPRPSPIDERHLNLQLADLAARMVDELLNKQFYRISSPPSACYYASPKPKDFQLFGHWNTQHAFDFINGTQSWHQPYRIEDANKKNILLRRAVAVAGRSDTPNDSEKQPPQENLVYLNFADGVLLAERFVG